MFYSTKHILKIFLMLIFAATVIYSQERINTSFEASADGKIFIYYQLNGDPQKEYNVDVVLKRTTVPSFELVPEDLSGNVGRGKYGDGSKKTIIWNLKPEEKAILDGDDFYFAVNAEEVETGSGGIPWYVYAGGAALAGGAAVLLLTKKSNSDDGGGTTTTFPEPPGRP